MTRIGSRGPWCAPARCSAIGWGATSRRKRRSSARWISPELIDRKVELLLDRAELYERKVGDLPLAASAYKEVLSIRPGEPRAAAALEGLSRRLSGHTPSSAPHDRPQAASPEVWD